MKVEKLFNVDSDLGLWEIAWRKEVSGWLMSEDYEAEAGIRTSSETRLLKYAFLLYTHTGTEPEIGEVVGGDAKK